MLLKALWPKVDWSTPQSAVASFAPGLDIEQVARDLLGVLQTQQRIEHKLNLLLKAAGIADPAALLVIESASGANSGNS